MGFAEDADSGVIVRWRHQSGLILDAIPLADRLAGFADRWLAPAAAEARARTSPSGTEIRAISPPWLLVMERITTTSWRSTEKSGVSAPKWGRR